MKRNFAYAGLNLSINKMHVLCIMLVKTRGVRYLNVETWMWFGLPCQNFWLRACGVPIAMKFAVKCSKPWRIGKFFRWLVCAKWYGVVQGHRTQTGMILPEHKKVDRSECNNYWGISLTSVEKSKHTAQCLKRRCCELNQSWMMYSVVFILAVILQTKFLLYSKIFRNHGSMPKTSTHVLSVKHTTRSLWKSFGSFAGVQCWRPLVTGRQVIVFLLRSGCPCLWSYIKTVHSGCWTPTTVCAFATPSHSLYKLNEQSSRWGCHFCKINRLLFVGDTACILWTGAPTCTWSVFCCMRLSGMKTSTVRPRYYIISLRKPKVVYAASEQQFTTAGGEVRVPWSGMHEWRKVEQGVWYTNW